MAGVKINQYPLERLSFGDDDYYDIDYWNGSAFETAKIKGSTIKAGIVAGITAQNIYTDNGTLTADRTMDGANFELFFHEVGKFIVHSHKNNIDNVVFEVRSQASYKSFTVKDHNTGNDLFSIENGKVEISGAYNLPTADGNNKDVLTTDGAGNITFAIPQNLFTEDLTLGANRSHDAVDYDWKVTHNHPTDTSVNALGIDTGKILHSGSRSATNSSYSANWFWGQYLSTFLDTVTGATTSIAQTNTSLILTNTDSVNDTTFLNLSPTTYNANHTGATTQSDLALTGTQSTLINQSGIGTNLATAKLDLTNSNSIFYYDVGNTISYIEAGPLKTFLKFEETGATPGGGVFEMSRSTGHSFTDNNTNGSGLLYGADYSANYTSRSLVDKAYVDANAGGDSIYTADGALSGARTVDLDANLLTFDTDTGGQIRLNRSDFSSTDIFKIIGYTAGGNLPFFKVGTYGQVELMGRLNASAFKVYKSGSTSEVCFDTGGNNGGGFIGKGIVTIGESISSYAYRNQSTSSYSFNRWYRGGNIEHCFNFDSSNPVSFTGFYINGVGNDYFVVGSGAKISTEKISLQGHTLVKGADTLSTSSALQIYDGDGTPSVLWDFRNNGDLIGSNGARIKGAVVNPSVQETASTATFTVNADEETMGVLTAMSADTTIASPTGSPVQGQKLMLRFTDDGSARILTWNAVFRAIGVTLPATTTASKLLYVGCIYNSTDSKWDVIAVKEEA